MKFFLRMILFAFAAIIPFAFSFYLKRFEKQPKETLIIGIFCAGSPYASMNLKGDFEGFDIDLSHKIAQKLNKKIDFRDFHWDLLPAALKLNLIDLIGSSFLMTPEELQRMDMIDVYGKPKQELTLICWQQIPTNIKSMADLKSFNEDNHSLIVRSNTVFANILAKHKIKNIVIVEQYDDLISPLKKGKAFASVVGPRHALAFQKKYPEIKVFKIPLDEPYAEGVGIAIKKGNTVLYEKVKKAIDELKKSGEIKELIIRNFGPDVQEV